MSWLHMVVNAVLMKNRGYYDPHSPKDYPAARQREVSQTAMVKIPKGGYDAQLDHHSFLPGIEKGSEAAR